MLMGVFGLIAGYFISSPFIMLLSDKVHSLLDYDEIIHMRQSAVVSLTEVFEPRFWPWSLTFSLLTATVFVFLGLIIKTRKSLDESDQLMRSYFEAGLVGMCITSPDMRLVQVNDTFCRMMGYTRQELLKTGLREITHPDDLEQTEYNFQQAVSGKVDGYNLEKRYLKKNGDTIHIILSVKVVRDAEGRFINSVSFVLDINDRKQNEARQKELELQLFRAQKMEAIGQLTGGIAHEFNNILTSILGFTTLAIRLCQRSTDDKLHDYLAGIKHGGERARTMIEQMMIYSRSMPAEHSRQLLAPMVDNVIKLVRPSMSGGIEIQWQPPAVSIAANIDPAQIEQTLLDMLINARDAMEGNGVISIILDTAEINGKECSSCHEIVAGRFAAITITDSGAGISKENLPHIFDPYFTTKEAGSGTGMGLSMAHGILHKCNGHVLLKTAVNQGTSFTLLFPYQVQDTLPGVRQEQEIAPASLPGSSQRQGRIIVIDDDTAVNTHLQHLLVASGYETTCFSDSVLALEYIRQYPDNIDLIITDQGMPGIAGLDLPRDIMLLRPRTKIIMISGYSGDVDARVAREKGIKAFLSKPLDDTLLLEKIDEILAQEPVQDYVI
jgi:PAS domain S-box-containing protein